MYFCCLKALIKIKKESRLQCIDIHGDAFIYYLIIFFSREVHEAVTVPTVGLILDITPDVIELQHGIDNLPKRTPPSQLEEETKVNIFVLGK